MRISRIPITDNTEECPFIKTKPIVLGHTQLFNLKRRGLDARVKSHYDTVKQPAYVVECAVALMVRNAFSSEDYFSIARNTLRKVFLEDDPSKLATVRPLCVYFRDYFSTNEWKQVIDRLFDTEQDYLRATEASRQNDHLHHLLHSGCRERKEPLNIATVYRDAAGKNHRFTLKDTDPCYSVEETTALLNLLTSLTIFERNGVRRFTELVRYFYLSTTPIYDSEEKTKQETKQEITSTPQPENQAKNQPATDKEMLQKGIAYALRVLAVMEIVDTNGKKVKYLQSSKYLQHNVYAGKTEKERLAYLTEGFTLDPATEETELRNRILTALVQGIRLKDAQSQFEAEEETPAAPNKQKKKNTKQNNKRRRKSKNGYETPEMIRKRREEEKRERHIRKITGRKKKGKKKR